MRSWAGSRRVVPEAPSEGDAQDSGLPKPPRVAGLAPSVLQVEAGGGPDAAAVEAAPCQQVGGLAPLCQIDRPGLAELGAFAAIVAHRSFRKAAEERGLSASTLSHMMRALETRLGVRLLHRTTRSVAPTEAGRRLAERLGPVFQDLDRALEDVGTLGRGPSGRLRINASEIAIRLLLADVVPAFLERHPAMTLDLVSDGRLVDIVAEGFDAGIRLAEAVPQDMIAVPFGGPVRFVAAAAPGYLAG
ncbi:LysR family transcriptional regulator, partial [Xanthomonas sp. Kuri4-3]